MIEIGDTLHKTVNITDHQKEFEFELLVKNETAIILGYFVSSPRVKKKKG